MAEVDLNSPENPLGNNSSSQQSVNAGEVAEELSKDLNLGDRASSLPIGIFAHSPNEVPSSAKASEGTAPTGSGIPLDFKNTLTGEETKPEPAKTSEIPVMRTYRSDAQRAVTDHNISLASVVIKEEEKRRIEAEKVVSGSRTNMLAVILALILLFGGAGIFGYFFLLRERPAKPGEVPTQVELPEPILFSDTQTILDVTGLEPRSVRFRLDTIIDESLRIGTIKNVVFTETKPFGAADRITLVNAGDMLTKFGLTVPERLPLLLNPQFMLGIHSFKKNSAFMIFGFENYQGVFSELLSWEKTMASELYPILAGENPPADLKTATWEDEVIQNIDTRVLRNETGTPYLFYSFLGTRNTLVITTDVDTLNEVRTRLQTPRGVTK